MARASILLIALALIAGMEGCGGGGGGSESYTLIIASTSGGTVTTPGVGTFTYGAGTVVNLVATPATNYTFANWTGDVTTVANINAAYTTITMNGNYSITGNFEIKNGQSGGHPAKP